MRNSTYRVVYRSVRQQIKEAMQQFPNLVNSNNRDFSIIFSDAPEFKFSFTLNERFPETSPKILLNGFDFPTSLTSFWQPTITVCQIVNHLHLIALAKNPNYSSGMGQNISFKANLNSSMPPRFNKNHPDFNSMTDPNENQDLNDDDKEKHHKNSHNENETKSEVEDDDEIDLDNIDVDNNSGFDDPPTELLNSSEDISDNKYSSIRSSNKNNQNNGKTSAKGKSNQDENIEEEEEVGIEIHIKEINEEEDVGENKNTKSSTKKNRKFKLKPNANGAAIQNRDIFLDIEELDAVVTESDEQRQKENELEHEFEDEDDGEEDEEEEELYEDNPTFDKMIRKLGYLYLKKNIDTIAYIQQYKELKKLVPKEDENDLL